MGRFPAYVFGNRPIGRGVAVFAAVAIVIAGGVAREAGAAPGDLDATFGDGGVVKMLPSEETIAARGVTVQPDERIVFTGIEDLDLIVARLLADGALDPSFGSGGKATLTLPTGFSEGRAAAIQPDGKIVVAGGGKGAVNGDFLVARFNPDGTPDAGFGGGDGVVVLPIGAEGERAEAVALGPGGRIAVTGGTDAGPKKLAGVAVLLGDGTPDPAFGGGDGIVTVETAEGNDSGAAVAMLADGRVLIGDSSGAGAGAGFALVQLLASGLPDPSFGGGDGVVLTPIPTHPTAGGRVTDLQLLGDGRIVAAGYGYDEVGTPPTSDGKFAAARYLADGTLDPGFGSGGIFTLQVGDDSDSAQAIELAENGRLLLAGEYTGPGPGGQSLAALRLSAEGALDLGFGSGGVVRRGVTAPFGELFGDAAVDPLERLVTVSRAYEGGGMTSVVVTRFLGDRPVPVPTAANRAPRARMKKVPRRVRAPRLKRFSGTASDPDGNATLARVQIALVRTVRGGARAAAKRPLVRRCSVLNRKGRLKRVRVPRGKRCPQRWLNAKGKARWSFKLKRRLPPGRYVAYARAVDTAGLATPTFTRKAGNRFAFRVPPRR